MRAVVCGCVGVCIQHESVQTMVTAGAHSRRWTPRRRGRRRHGRYLRRARARRPRAR